MEIYRVSVRDLVAFNSDSGDLGGGSPLNASRAQLGSREHRRIQGSRNDSYLSEYSLKTQIEESTFYLEVFGRADGIYTDSDPHVIEEIKTVKNLTDWKDSHWDQAKLYAHLYIVEQLLKGNNFENIGVKLLYIDIKDGAEREETRHFSKVELNKFFNSIVYPYINFLKKNQDHELRRNSSLKDLKFPFDNFRKGQREFSVDVFRAIRDNKTLFSLAPTGTGKSMATIFPALKVMAEGAVSKIFFLTAKTVGRKSARESLNIIRNNQGTYIKSVVLTAKEKSCINKEYSCNPDICPYANNYYKKLPNALKDLEKVDDYFKDNIEEYARKHTICPFELSLDLSLNSDLIICDYNYVFDLRVQLKRFFDSVDGNYTLLVDEAHNLPDRLRNCYSGRIDRADVNPLVDVVKYESERVSNGILKLSNYLHDLKEENKDNFNNGFIKDSEVPSSLIKILRSLSLHCEEDLLDRDFSGKNLLLDFYYNSLFFIKLSEIFSDGHRFLIESRGGMGVAVEIFCIDPSFTLSKILDKTKSQVFFSGTLYPLNYYTDMIIRDREFLFSRIPSPFNREQLKLVVRDDIKTTYKERARYYQEVANCIKDVYLSKKGNYMVFFPSYSYMDEVRKLMDIDVHIQEQGMDETEREDYLNKFKEDKGVLSFAIMGGVFGEGIDLVGDLLIGVVVVGVGLPGISYYGDLIKEYYNYNYAYTFPGFNKVVQAVGRVIRGLDDSGVAVLIDSRFNTPLYRSLFPAEWSHIRFSRDEFSMKKMIK